MDLYHSRYPCERRAQPAWMFLWFFAKIWQAGSALDRWRKRARGAPTAVPRDQRGNITAGGTGKTPVTIELLHEFRDSAPGILTRGHGRSTSEIVLLNDGEQLPIAMTGDEAQLYMRLAHVPIGIAAERYEAGSRLLAAAPVRLFFSMTGSSICSFGVISIWF